MRHRKHRHLLGVTTAHRTALISNLAASLLTKGRIKTTLARARALRPFVDKIITRAKQADAQPRVDGKLGARALYLRRLARTQVRDDAAIALLFNEKVKQFTKRPGGYTRIYKLAVHRLGDAAEMAIIELVGADDPGYKKSRGRKAAAKTPVAAETPAAESPAASAAEPQA